MFPAPLSAAGGMNRRTREDQRGSLDIGNFPVGIYLGKCFQGCSFLPSQNFHLPFSHRNPARQDPTRPVENFTLQLMKFELPRTPPGTCVYIIHLFPLLSFPQVVHHLDMVILYTSLNKMMPMHNLEQDAGAAHMPRYVCTPPPGIPLPTSPQVVYLTQDPP